MLAGGLRLTALIGPIIGGIFAQAIGFEKTFLIGSLFLLVAFYIVSTKISDDKNTKGESAKLYRMNRLNNKKEATDIAILLPIRETRNPAGISNNIIPNPLSPRTAAA